MIKTLNILNFQSHKDSQLEFAPGVNVIVGASDSGKTAIIRALRWLIWNRPGGDAFRSTWAKDETDVVIETTNTKIWRRKGKDNAYFLRNNVQNNGIIQGEDWTEYRAFGSDVPEEVATELNMDETNLQMQLDKPFLISDSAGEIAKYFNHVAHLDQIDIGVKYLNTTLRQLDSRQGFLAEQKKEIEEALTQYEYLDKTEVDLQAVEGVYHRHQQKIITTNRLRWLIDQIRIINREVKEIEEECAIETEVNSILDKINQWRDKTEVSQQLRSIAWDVDRINRELEEANKLTSLEATVISIQDRVRHKKDLQIRYNAYASTITTLKSVIAALLSKADIIAEYEQTFHENFPDICPLCGNNTT